MIQNQLQKVWLFYKFKNSNSYLISYYIISQNSLTLLKVNYKLINNKINSQQMSCKNQQTQQSYFEQMLNEMKPKARYISQMHTQQYIDSIYLQIINGDTQVATEKIPIQNKNQKQSFQDMLKLRILNQANRQKQLLQQKLSYLTNSINALNKYDELSSRKSPKSMRVSSSIGQSRPQQWRQDIEQRAKDIAKRKKIAQETKSKKIQEIKQIQERVRQQQLDRKKKQILQNVKSIQQRSKKRSYEVKIGNQRYKQLRREKSLHQKISQSFQQKQLSFLQQRKKKLSQIRNLHKPLDELEIKQHQQRFLQNKRQKQQLRQRQKRMNESRSNSYQPFYKSLFYQKALEQSRNQQENLQLHKKQKIKQYAQRVKQHFVPQIDERKKQQIQELIQKQKRKIEQKAQKQRQLREKYKQKGIQYLQEVKKLPKKPRTASVDLTNVKSQKKQYPNYLTHTQKQPSKPWNKILQSGVDRQQKAILLQYQSQKHEEELKRKEQQVRLMKKGNSGDIDQQYFEMIKAKLDLLQTGV